MPINVDWLIDERSLSDNNCHHHFLFKRFGKQAANFNATRKPARALWPRRRLRGYFLYFQ
jgi:hypothetical protein